MTNPSQPATLRLVPAAFLGASVSVSPALGGHRLDAGTAAVRQGTRLATGLVPAGVVREGAGQ